MAVYSVEGKLGTGKTKFCVWRAQEALRAGRRVASNVDLKTEVLTPERRTFYCRLPDKPTATDLDAIGHGNPDSYDEDRNGVMILDELGTWLNSRTFQDKERLPLIDWLIHARKKGWDVYLIVQDANMIDRQVREALIEYQCRCIRLDKVKMPVIGSVLGIFHRKLAYLPRAHVTTARMGFAPNQVVAERWVYRADDLHPAYDTRQCFTPSYPHGAHTVLPPWDFNPQPSWVVRLWANARAMTAGAERVARSATLKPRPAPRSKLPQVERLMRCAWLSPDQRQAIVARWERRGLLQAL
jgi:hypothetical protein